MRVGQVLFAVSVAVFLRALLSVHTHSGQGQPPLRGDYEAQRHWMEVTSSLPAVEWYWGNVTPANNLSYWGLDYPPLTAFHSFALGHVGRTLHPSAFAVLSSRGAEDEHSKQFMRWSVVASDLLTYVPASLLFALRFRHQHTALAGCLAASLANPALLLVDHGHFQYNGVALGFVTLAALLVDSAALSAQLMGAIMFVFALNFKHMTLYFAPSFFFFLLARSFSWRHLASSFARVFLIGVVVIAAFAALWSPFLKDPQTALQVVRRLFPVARGIFEDKVANFWCSVSPVLKVKTLFQPSQMFAVAAGTTLMAFLPSCVLLVLRPTFNMFCYNLACVSLSFFLFSFQVHEKSFLMPLLPLTLVAVKHYELWTWTTFFACFSMFPLLVRDGLLFPYISSLILLHVLGYWNFWTRVSTIPALFIHILWAVVVPPAQLPHLWPVACTTYSFVMFMLLFLYLYKLQWNELKIDN